METILPVAYVYLYEVRVADNEFTQLMKGLQGERLRQAFKFLDKDQDGYIRPEQFKKIILVRRLLDFSLRRTSVARVNQLRSIRILLAINCRMPLLRGCRR